MIEVEKLNGLSEYRKAAVFFLKFINHKYLIRDEEAIRITIEAILFSQEKHKISEGTLFNFAVNNTRQFIYRYLEKQKPSTTCQLTEICHYDTPLSLLIKEEEKSNILNIIDGLSGKKKRCVELLYYNGLNQHNISKELDIAPQNIYNIFKSLRKDFYVLQEEKE